MNKRAGLYSKKNEDKEALSMKFFEFNPRKLSYSGDFIPKMKKILDNKINSIFSPIHSKGSPDLKQTLSASCFSFQSKEMEGRPPRGKLLRRLEIQNQFSKQMESSVLTGIRLPSRISDAKPRTVLLEAQKKPSNELTPIATKPATSSGKTETASHHQERSKNVLRHSFNLFQFEDLRTKLQLDAHKEMTSKLKVRKPINKRLFYSIAGKFADRPNEKAAAYLSQNRLPNSVTKEAPAHKGFSLQKRFKNFDNFEISPLTKEDALTSKHFKSASYGWRAKTEPSLNKKSAEKGQSISKIQHSDVFDDHSPEPWSTYHIAEDENNFF